MGGFGSSDTTCCVLQAVFQNLCLFGTCRLFKMAIITLNTENTRHCKYTVIKECQKLGKKQHGGEITLCSSPVVLQQFPDTRLWECDNNSSEGIVSLWELGLMLGNWAVYSFSSPVLLALLAEQGLEVEVKPRS